MTVSAILTADNHLDPTAFNFGPDRFQRKKDHLKCFEEVVDYAKKERPELFLIGGDLFDGMRPSNAARAAVMQDLKELAEHRVKVFAVSGHHDTPRSFEEGASPLAVYAKSGYMHYFANPSSPETVMLEHEGLSIAITGVGHNSTHAQGDDPVTAIKTKLDGDFNVVLAHCPVQGFTGWTGDEPVIRPSSIPPEVDLLLVGHFHNHQSKKIGRTEVIYPGSTERVDFAEEEDDKGFVWVEFGKDGIVSQDFIKTDARRFRTVVVQFPDSPNPLEQLKEEVGPYFDKDVVLRVMIKGITTPLGLAGYRRPELSSFCQGKVFHPFIDDDKLEVRRPDRSDLGRRATPLQELEAYFSKQMEDSGVDEKAILKEALELSRSKLQEKGAW